MLLRVLLLSLTFCVHSLSVSAGGDASASPGDAAELAALLGDTRSMQAEFTQRVVSDEGELLEESSGSMAFQRPHQLRWEIIEPYRYLVLTDGETLWRYDPDFEQLSTESFTSVAQTPMLILAASAVELNAQYQISSQIKSAGKQFHLEPRSKDAEFTRLTLVFDDRNLREMQLTDNLGQDTRILLNDIKVNRETLADSLFVFEQPGAGRDQ